MRSFTTCLLLRAVVALLTVSGSQAQNTDPNNDTGVHAYETYDGARENINLGTGNVFVSIPLLALPGRNGHNYSVALTSNSQTWSPTTGSPQSLGMVPTRTGSILFHPSGVINPRSGIQCLTGYTLTDENGGVHTFSGILSDCVVSDGGPNQGQRSPEDDRLGGGDDRGEGISADLSATGCRVTFPNGDWVPLVTGSSGCPLVGYIGNSSANAPVLTDSNGNQITVAAYSGTGTDTDTLGRAITYSGTNNTIQYKDSGGATRTISLNPYTLPLSSCVYVSGGVSTPLSGTANVITSAVLPNGLTYIFHYDKCGNVDKVVYPSGGYTR